jgi:hypothetical protein
MFVAKVRAVAFSLLQYRHTGYDKDMVPETAGQSAWGSSDWCDCMYLVSDAVPSYAVCRPCMSSNIWRPKTQNTA